MIDRVEVVGYGRPASMALADAVARAKNGGPLAPVTVIVPSNLAGLTARRLLGAGAVGAGGVANVSFVTPFRLAELLAADLLFGTRPLTNPVLGAAVRLALAHDPGPFAPVADHYATEAALASLYAELSNVRAETLMHIAADGGESARTAVRFHHAIAAKLGAFHDEADVARAAGERTDLSGALVPFGHVIWYLPAPTTAPIAELIGHALSAAPSAVVVGTTGDDHADLAVWSTCATAGVQQPTAPAAPRPTADHIVSVTDADEEVRAVVRRIAALAESGIALDRIGVFHPTPDPYVGILEQQLAAAGIPANGPTRRRLADTVAGRTLLAALELPAQRWRRDKVMALASGGPLRTHDGPVRPAAWEQLSRQAGVVHDLSDWRRKLHGHRSALETRLSDVDRDAHPGRVEYFERDLADFDRLAAFVDELSGSVTEVERTRGWPGKAAAATALLEQLLGPDHRHSTWPELEQDAFENVADVLVRLASLDELEPDPTHEVFIRALTTELDVTKGRSGRFGQGVVFGPLASAAGHDLDAVFVLGCAEGLCPRARRDDAMLPDAARALAPGELEPRAARLDEQHRSFLAALASAPAGARHLTFARGDLRGGRHALPSRWLLDSASALAGHTVHATDFPELDAPVVDVVPSYASGLVHTAVHASADERDLAAVSQWQHVGHAVIDHPVVERVARGLEAQSARRSDRFTEWDGNLAGQPVPSAAERSLSPSRLESWATCGYRYFLRFVLDLGDRDDPERVVDLSPLDKGSGVHLALERFISETIVAGPPAPDEPWSDEQHDRLAAIANEVFADQEARGRTGRSVHWQITKADLLAMLDDFLLADDEYRAETRSRPERVELPFGLDDSPPVTLTLADGRSLDFRGIADRVDRGAGGRMLVSDYKTGRGDAYEGIDDDDPVQAGTTLQLGLYAEAATQLLGATSAEAHYWMVNPTAGYARHGYPWTDDRRQRFVDVLATIADGIEAGVFPMVPGDWNIWRRTHENCKYCEFDGLCDRARGEEAEAKLAAPALRRRDPLVWDAEP